jgi:hypothetical protein
LFFHWLRVAAVIQIQLTQLKQEQAEETELVKPSRLAMSTTKAASFHFPSSVSVEKLQLMQSTQLVV